MHEIDIDVVGTQSTQRIIDLAKNSSAARIAVYLGVAPFQPGLGRDHRLPAHARNRLADDLLGYAKAVDRRGIDEVDALVQCRTNRGDRLAFVGSPPHPAAHCPCS